VAETATGGYVMPAKYQMMPDEGLMWLGPPPTTGTGDPSVARTVFPGTSPPPDPGPLRLPRVNPAVMNALLARLRARQGLSQGP